MQEEGAQDNAVNQANPETNRNGKKSFRPIWLSDTVAGFTCLVLTGVIGPIGAALLNGHPKPILTAWGLIFLSSSFFGGSACFGLRVHRKKQLKNKMPAWLPLVVFVGITLVGLLFSTFAIWQETPEIAPKSLPILTIELGTNLDPKNPAGQVFIVCNQGPGVIRDIECKIIWDDPDKAPTLLNFISLQAGAELKPGMKQSVHCFGNAGFPIFSDRTFVNFSVEYSVEPFKYKTNSSFKFCLSRNAEGVFTWFPAGEGQSFPDLLGILDKRIKNLQSNPVSRIPLLDVNITDIERDTNTVPGHPLKITYSWKNIGGRPATKLSIQWGLYDAHANYFRMWSNLWSKTITDQILLPGMTNGEVRFYSDTGTAPLFDGIVSGKLVLFGQATFADLESVDFTEDFKVIHTNGGFETRYFGIHSKYGDWQSK